MPGKDLAAVLRQMKQNSAFALDVYRGLGVANLIALVRAGTEREVAGMEFLTYPAADGMRELPLFTSAQFVIAFPGEDTVQATVTAADLWPRMVDLVENGVCEVAVDPGQDHGIRLRKEMVLGIIHGVE
jgi:SseB protein N-terminal domain